MKKIQFKNLAVAAIAVTVLFTSCKKSQGPQGPAGPQGPSGVVTTSSDGYIKGTLSGMHRDGSAFSESFNFPNYWGGPACTLDSSSVGGFTFNLNRGTDILSSNYAYLQVTTFSLTNFSSASASLDLTFVRALSASKEFEFSTSNTVYPTLSSVTYNTTTGQFAGTFSVSISGSNNNTGNTATIQGTFQSSVTQLYYRLAHH